MKVTLYILYVAGQQQQLNEQYAKAQEHSLQPSPMTHRRHRRMSADNHHQKSPKHSYSHVSGGKCL